MVQEIRAALEVTDHPFFELADDNTFINKKWAKEFLRAIAPLELNWFTETDISVADDDELLTLMAESGCRQILIGLESPEGKDLDRIDPHNWKRKRSDRYLEAIEKIQSTGVTVNGCFILGLDNHTPEIFGRVKEFVDRSRLLEVQVTVLTPFPGTPLYERMRAERLTAEGALLGPLHPVRRQLHAEGDDGRAARGGHALAVPGDLQRARVRQAQAPLHGNRKGAALSVPFQKSGERVG